MPGGTHTRARAHQRTRRACSDAPRVRTRACIRHSLRRTGVVRAGCAEPRARGRAADVRRVPAGTPGGPEHPSPCGLEHPLTGAETPPQHCRSAELCGRVIGACAAHAPPASGGLLQHPPGALTTYRACGPSQHILRVRSCVQRRIADGAELYHIKKTKPLAARWGGASAADERGLWDDGTRRTPMRMS
jgi:hypothetical protein